MITVGFNTMQLDNIKDYNSNLKAVQTAMLSAEAHCSSGGVPIGLHVTRCCHVCN